MHVESYRTFSLLIALAFLSCLAVAAVWAQDAVAETPVASYEVRMTVDPTVLPTVENPDATAPLEEESVSVEPIEKEQPEKAEPATVLPYAPVEQVETQDTEVVPTPGAEPKTVPAPKGDPTIRKIALKSTNREFVITLTCDRPAGDTSYLNLSNPSRFVLDLRQSWVYTGPNVIRTSSGKVKYMVTGKHPDRFRMVVHLRTPPKGRLIPKLEQSGNTLVVTVPLQ